MIWLFLACADPIEAAACDAVESDSLHALSGSSDPALEEPGAMFHIDPHHHIIDLDGSAWIWSEGSGEDVIVYTDAVLVTAEVAGESQSMDTGEANSQCPEALPASYELTLTEGIWDFQLEGTGTFSWIAAPVDASETDHSEHNH